MRAFYERPVLGNAGGRSAEFGVRGSASSPFKKNAESLVREAKWALRNNWTEEARDASLAVRKAKAKKRGLDDEDEDAVTVKKKVKDREKARERAVARVREKLRRKAAEGAKGA